MQNNQERNSDPLPEMTGSLPKTTAFDSREGTNYACHQCGVVHPSSELKWCSKKNCKIAFCTGCLKSFNLIIKDLQRKDDWECLHCAHRCKCLEYDRFL